jgi:TonB-dependent SusC/RagA subfamily outer membrane receptor
VTRKLSVSLCVFVRRYNSIKDAQAAIYGSAAANGVILIT